MDEQHKCQSPNKPSYVTIYKNPKDKTPWTMDMEDTVVGIWYCPYCGVKLDERS